MSSRVEKMKTPFHALSFLWLCQVDGLFLRAPSRRSLLAGLTQVVVLGRGAIAQAASEDAPIFQRPSRIQFIAALGDPKASSGNGADTWGLWKEDPGPRGVRLRGGFERLHDSGNIAPAGWKFNDSDWWLEEHGLIMESPIPLPARKFVKADKSTVPKRRYVVTGDREVTTVLTVHDDGKWELAEGTLFDVTHLPCRSARYAPSGPSAVCSPAEANLKDFPVKPGADMPVVSGCSKQDYAVLFVVGLEQ